MMMENEEAVMPVASSEPNPDYATMRQRQPRNDDNDDYDDFGRFFLSEPISEQELETVGPYVQEKLNQILDDLNDRGPHVVYEEYQQSLKRVQQDQDLQEKEFRERALQEAKIGGGARDYQKALVELAKKRNIIVHLGTGMGKTNVALDVIKHFAVKDFGDGGFQTMFLVPSVAFAIQQTTTLLANLDNTVGMASPRTVKGERHRKALAQCNIIVATHGAMKDLLSHFGDLFKMEKINLLILDECHNCTGELVVYGAYGAGLYRVTIELIEAHTLDVPMQASRTMPKLWITFITKHQESHEF